MVNFNQCLIYIFVLQLSATHSHHTLTNQAPPTHTHTQCYNLHYQIEIFWVNWTVLTHVTSKTSIHCWHDSTVIPHVSDVLYKAFKVITVKIHFHNKQCTMRNMYKIA